MRHDSKYQCDLELATRQDCPQAQHQVQNQAGFSCRMSIGELRIYALRGRPNGQQYGANPANIHYQAVRHVVAYLNNTRTDG